MSCSQEACEQAEDIAEAGQSNDQSAFPVFSHVLQWSRLSGWTNPVIKLRVVSWYVGLDKAKQKRPWSLDHLLFWLDDLLASAKKWSKQNSIAWCVGLATKLGRKALITWSLYHLICWPRPKAWSLDLLICWPWPNGNSWSVGDDPKIKRPSA